MIKYYKMGNNEYVWKYAVFSFFAVPVFPAEINIQNLSIQQFTDV